MNKSNLQQTGFPHIHIGMRTVKTVIVVFLSLCLAHLRQDVSNPLYISIAAILCIQPTMESSRKVGTDRLIGTVVGGFWGIIVYLLNHYTFLGANIIVKYAIVAICLIPIIYTNIIIRRASMVSTSAVVYLIITVSSVGVMTNFQFVYNRLLDTFFGFLIALVVNMVKLPNEDAAENKADVTEESVKENNDR